MRRQHETGIRGRLDRLRTRVARFVRQLFGGSDSAWERPDDVDGGVGVREPRRPLTPTLGGSVALDLPDEPEL